MVKFPNQKVIGDHVRFTHTVVREYGPGSRCTYAEVTDGKTRHAVITGCKHLFEGRVVLGSWDEPNHFEPEKGMWVYTARQGFSNKEIYLPTTGPNVPKLTCCTEKCMPFRHQTAHSWTEADLADARAWAAKQKRDARGRFVKETS